MKKVARIILIAILIMQIVFPFAFDFCVYANEVDMTEDVIMNDSEISDNTTYKSEEVNDESEDDYEKYSEEYKKYLQLSDEEKANYGGAIPEKYDVSIEDFWSKYEQIKEEEKEEKSKSNSLELIDTSSSSNPKSTDSSYDMRDYVTNIRVEDQGSEGLCWTFASLGALRTTLAKQYGLNYTYDLSEWHLNYLTSTEYPNKGNTRKLGKGGTFSRAVDYFKNNDGPVLEEKCRYQSNVTSLKALDNMQPDFYVHEVINFPSMYKVKQSNGKVKVTNSLGNTANALSNNEVNSVRDAIKEHIIEHGGLYCAIRVNTQRDIFKKIDGMYAARYDDGRALPDEEIGGHAVTIVGWDDNYSRYKFNLTPEHNGAYLVLNSWGKDSEFCGYEWISYDDYRVESALSGYLKVDKTEKYNSYQFKNKSAYEKFINSFNIKKQDGVKLNSTNKTIDIIDIRYNEETAKYRTGLSFNKECDDDDLNTFLKYKLPTITHIIMDNNNLTKIPANIKNCTNLNTLCARNNHITSVSNLLGCKDTLETLYLSNNELEQCNDLSKLNNLKSLKLDGNKIRSLPTFSGLDTYSAENQILNETLKNRLTYTYPNIINSAKSKNNILYSKGGLTFVGCEETSDGKGIKITNVKRNPIYVKVNSGIAKGTCIYFTLVDNTAPQAIIFGGAQVYGSGLLRYYDGHNNTGTGHSKTVSNWKDIANKQNAIVNGGASFGTDGYLLLDGSNDWVNMGQVTNLDKVTLETEVVFKKIEKGNKMILCNYESGGVGLYLKDGYLVFEVYIDGNAKYVKMKEPLLASRNYHISGTYNGEKLQLYLNGILQGETAATGSIDNPSNSTVMAIGTNPNGANASQVTDVVEDNKYCNMKVYAVRIYNRAIGASTIKKNMTADRIKPVPISTNSAEINMTLRFNEDIEGLTESDLEVIRTDSSGNKVDGDVGNIKQGTLTQIDKSNYTFTVENIPMSAYFKVQLKDKSYTDQLGNEGKSAFVRGYRDGTSPKVTITSNTTDTTSAKSIKYTFTISENATELTEDEIEVTNGTKGTFTKVDEKNYTLDVTNTKSGTQTVTVKANSVYDKVGNANVETSKTTEISLGKLTCTIEPNTSVTNSDYVSYRIRFSQPVQDFDESDLTIKNGTISYFHNLFNNQEYAVTLYHTKNAEQAIQLAAGKCQDGAGNLNLKSNVAKVIIDKTPPTIVLNKVETSKNKDTICFAVSDVGSGIDSVFVAGEEIEYSDANNITYDVEENGSYIIEVKDLAGNVTKKTVAISNIDVKLPTLQVTGNPTSWTNEDVVLKIAASDEESGLKTVKVNGTEVDINDGIGEFIVKENGSYRFVATDNAGNSNSQIITVDKIDKENPELAVTGNPSSWTNKDVVLTITAKDEDSGINAVKLVKNETDETQIQLANNTGTATITSNGTYKVIAIDTAGNSIEKTVKVKRIDKTKPRMEILGNPSKWTNDDVIIEVEAKDSASGIPEENAYSFDGGNSWQTDNKKVFTKNTSNVEIQVKDAVGNIATKTINIDKIDKISPTLSATGDLTTQDVEKVVLNITASDNESGLEHVTVNENEIELTNGTATFTVTDNGDYYVIATDYAGNETVGTVKITNIAGVDSTPPKLKISGNPSSWTNKSVTLTITASDVGTGVQSVLVDNNPLTLSKGKGKFVVDQNSTHEVLATDNMGLTTKKTVVVDKIDKNIPTFEISGNPTNWTNDGYATITINAQDDESGLADEPYSFDGGISWQAENTKTYPANSYEIPIQVKDKAGNTTPTRRIDVTQIDNIPPEVEITGEPSEWVKEAILTINATDEGSGVNTVTVNGQAITYENGQSTYKVTQNGTYEIVATDTAGNSSTKQIVNITKIDKTAPTITSVTKTPETLTNDNVIIKINANDTESGVKEYSFDNGKTWQTENEKIYYENTTGIKIKVKDNVGNIKNYSDEINIENIVQEKGDINKDSKINIADVIGVIRHIGSKEGSKYYLDEEKRFIADINQDGKINIADVIGLIRLISKSR